MTAYRRLIRLAANDYGLDAQLVEAVVIVESSGHTDAFRFEPRFYDRYLKGHPDYQGQIPRRVSSSYGLMQCMFSTARDLGFTGEPEMLFLPDVGLDWGCQKLKAELTWAKGDVRKALAAYNAGRGGWRSDAGQRYCEKVLRTLETLTLGDST